MTSSLRILLPVSVAFVLTACSLSKTADNMVATSHDINDQSHHLAKRTDDLEAKLSEKGSFDTFEVAIGKLFGSEIDRSQPDAQLNPEADLFHFAGAAINSLYFQYWDGDYNDDINELDRRLSESLETLFTASLKYIPRSFEVNVFAEPDRAYKAVATLGALMDRVSHNYIRNSQNNGFDAISVYSIMVSALRNRLQDGPRNELLPLASQMVRTYAAEAVYFLQLRHNYLPMMAIYRATKFPDMNNLQRLWLIFFGGTTVDLSDAKYNDDELKVWTSYLRKSLETRSMLSSICIRPRFNTNFVNIQKGVDFGQYAKAAPIDASVKEKARLDFLDAYRSVLATSNNQQVSHDCRLREVW